MTDRASPLVFNGGGQGHAAPLVKAKMHSLALSPDNSSLLFFSQVCEARQGMLRQDIFFEKYARIADTKHFPMIDDLWTHDIYIFSGTFAYYRNTPRPVRGKIHTSQESYRLDSFEQDIRPIPTLSGRRTYVMLKPYVLEPILTFTVGLYKKPKAYADMDEAIGQTLGGPKQEGVREVEIGNAQTWYYEADKTIEIWECFLESMFRTHPLVDDPHMQKLWQGIEAWLIRQFPEAIRIVTPSNDPITHSPQEYQTFLRSLGYDPVAKSAFGKPIVRGELPRKGR